MMINALNHIQNINHELITFSDDMDGLRKVPENIPNDELLRKNLGKPLTSIPDPLKSITVLESTIMKCLKNFSKTLNLNLILKVQLKITKKGFSIIH